ncbi:MAG: glycogen synthase GlgA [Endomicrobiales bacterium]|nr:glycogen synthase GlgA [Endomicrobiales bacterium]
MRILMAASECVPFIKVGGLADIMGTLPKYLKKEKQNPAVFIPKYKSIDDNKFNLRPLPHKILVKIGENYEEASIKKGSLDNGVPVYFIDNAKYFYRYEVYGTKDGDYEDNDERFIFFSKAVLEAAKVLNFKPDIINCHDWQTALIPAFLKILYKNDDFFSKTKSLYTIHNLAYQGHFKKNTLLKAGFTWDYFSNDKMEYYGGFNFMKTGLIYADKISTVSPNYSKEIQTRKYGAGMDGILDSRKNEIVGILNGIDYDYWNPDKDEYIEYKFSKDNFSGKTKCKSELQKACNLKTDSKTFLVGSVSRLDPQKGYDLLIEAIPKMLKNNIQFVLLGRGNADIEESLRQLASENPDRISVDFEFNEPLAHKIYAGSDAFLLPSRFEPCGLSQMISLAYGTIPIVHKTGGLADTIIDFNEKSKKGNGFVFEKEDEADDFVKTVERAINVYNKKNLWESLVRNAFQCDFSWDKSVKKYIELYKSLTSRKNKNEVKSK